MAETGKPGLGILDLYRTYLGATKDNVDKPETTTLAGTTAITKSSLPPINQLLPLLANVAYFFLHYAMMVAYISQGGQNLVAMFQGNIGVLEGSNDFVVASQVVFASVSAITLYALSQFPVGVQNFNSVLVVGVVISFLGLIGIGAPTVERGVITQQQYEDIKVSLM
jgi:amino acid permease